LSKQKRMKIAVKTVELLDKAWTAPLRWNIKYDIWMLDQIEQLCEKTPSLAEQYAVFCEAKAKLIRRVLKLVNHSGKQEEKPATRKGFFVKKR
jgi:hypothetical protein